MTNYVLGQNFLCQNHPTDVQLDDGIPRDSILNLRSMLGQAVRFTGALSCQAH